MIYEYYINLDERGDFQSDIRRADGVTIWEITCGEDLAELVQDGFIRHGRDMDGIKAYCVMHNIIRSDDTLVKMND